MAVKSKLFWKPINGSSKAKISIKFLLPNSNALSSSLLNTDISNGISLLIDSKSPETICPPAIFILFDSLSLIWYWL